MKRLNVISRHIATSPLDIEGESSKQCREEFMTVPGCPFLVGRWGAIPYNKFSKPKKYHHIWKPEEVRKVLKDTQTFSSMIPSLNVSQEVLEKMPEGHWVRELIINIRQYAVVADGEKHKKLRSALPKRLMVYDLTKKENSAWIRCYVRKLLSVALAKKHAPPGKRVIDVVHELANPLGKELLVRILGLRGRMNTAVIRSNLLKCAHSIGDLGERFEMRYNTTNYASGVEFFTKAVLEVKQCLAYGMKSSDYDLEHGLIAKLVRDGKITSVREIVNQCMMIVLAASHNLSNLVCLAIVVMLQHPEQLQELRRRVTREPYSHEKLLHQTALEILRFKSPGPLIVRFAVGGRVVGNSDIKSGDAVILHLEKANHVMGGSKFDIFKKIRGKIPWKHLAFGFGPHRCLGGETGLRVAELVIEVLFLSDLLPNQKMGNGFDPEKVLLKTFECKENSCFTDILEMKIFA